MLQYFLQNWHTCHIGMRNWMSINLIPGKIFFRKSGANTQQARDDQACQLWFKALRGVRCCVMS
jgi:hypothetical protein